MGLGCPFPKPWLSTYQKLPRLGAEAEAPRSLHEVLLPHADGVSDHIQEIFKLLQTELSEIPGL